MAKQHYRPYYYSRRQRNRNIGYSLLAVVVIIAGVIFFNKLRGQKEVTSPELAKDVEVIDVTSADEGVVLQTGLERDVERELDFEPEGKPEGPRPIPEGLKPVIESGDVGTEAAELIAEARQDIASGKVIAARDKLNQVLLSRPLSLQESNAVKAILAELSNKWLFSREPYSGDTLTGTYKVQAGNLLSQIAKQYKVPYEILMTINNIKRPENLRAGETIKVINGPFHAIVYRSLFIMDLYLGNKTYVKSYRVGLGEEGLETPTGKWRVKKDGKLIKPTWTDPATGKTYVADAPDYPLGSRWIALEGLDGNAKGRTGFAVHGTKDPQTIGTRSSRGCIRLLNGEAIELYNLLAPGLSEVRVVD